MWDLKIHLGSEAAKFRKEIVVPKVAETCAVDGDLGSPLKLEKVAPGEASLAGARPLKRGAAVVGSPFLAFVVVALARRAGLRRKAARTHSPNRWLFLHPASCSGSPPSPSGIPAQW